MEDKGNSKFVKGINQVKFFNFVYNVYGKKNAIIDNTRKEYIEKLEHNKSAVLHHLGNKAQNSNSKKVIICKYFSSESSSCIACILLSKS